MADYLIEIDEVFELPRRQVFMMFADHYRFGKLIGAPVKRIKDSLQADPNGIGSVRRVGLGPLSVEETVLGFEPDLLIEYTIISLSPLRNHRGRIRFSETQEGHTRVHYVISFDAAIPLTGSAFRALLERRIRRGVRRLPQLV
ncbi:SRPBCC family protein [Marinobacter fuscus]|uniref:SRPBCC family protein n=1 Tax=Marinobacter fuscus TaxID=2109942 RepID=A0A2T1KL26_9GAMM|nr:SRPBCC family protein [Marinobacter fuscus]PSF10728.1 SRPBCC family protein [Marinobacter fuscus]